MEEVYDYAGARRAGLIPKTESFRAANLASKDAWRLRVVKAITWFTVEDADVCQFCQTLDGMETVFDVNFFNLGDSVKGVKEGFMTLDYSNGEPPLSVRLAGAPSGRKTFR